MTRDQEVNLLILAKRPALGKVKTRLAASVGNQMAFELYQILLKSTIQLAMADGIQAYFCLSGDEDYAFPSNSHVFEQSKGDLGQRMKKAFEYVFDLSNKPVIMIGSDCYDLTPEHIQKASKALHSSDLVFGPSEDGGYYLIGMRTFIPEILEQMPWSTSELMKCTTNRAKQLGLEVSMLDVLNDIDTFADLQKSSLWKKLPNHVKNEIINSKWQP